MANEQCPICGGTGFLPFTLPDGTVSKYARIFCPDCHDSHYDDHRRALQPEDIDFPISYSVWRSLCREHGWQDPGPDYPSEPERPQEQVIVHRHSDMSKLNYDLLQQTARRTQFLENKIAEMTKRRKPETYGYKGIR